MRIPAALAALMVLCTVVPDAMANPGHTKAIRVGEADKNLYCPNGSGWYPIDGGICLSCPGRKAPIAGACPGLKKVTKHAFWSYKKKFDWTPCRPGDFKRPGTKECWTCGLGYVRKPGTKFSRKKHICISLKAQVVKPKIVKRVAWQDLVNPKKLSDEIRDLGCGYRKGAFFSLTGGGTCWVCPGSHPKRSLHPANSRNACMTRSCGKLGERPCMISEHFLPCKKGTRFDVARQQCVTPKNIACKPMVIGVRALRDVMRKAGSAADKGRDAIEKLPGVAAVKSLIKGITGKVDEMAAAAVSKMPTRKIEADLTRIFRSPEDVRAMAAIVEAINKRRGRIVDLALNEKVSCGDPARLKRELLSAIRGASRADAAPTAGQTFAGLFGVSPARAAAPGFLRGRTIALTIGVLANRQVVALPKHLNVGIEVVLGFNKAGTDASLGMNLVYGLDLIHRPAPNQIGEVGLYVGFGGFGRDNCGLSDYGLQLGGGGIVSIAANHCGLMGVSFNLAGLQPLIKANKSVADVMTPAGMIAIVKPAKKVKLKGSGPSPSNAYVLGFNLAWQLAGKRGGVETLLAP